MQKSLPLGMIVIVQFPYHIQYNMGSSKTDHVSHTSPITWNNECFSGMYKCLHIPWQHGEEMMWCEWHVHVQLDTQIPGTKSNGYFWKSLQRLCINPNASISSVLHTNTIYCIWFSFICWRGQILSLGLWEKQFHVCALWKF